MWDYDAVIIGGGPAGLTAGVYLSRAKYRTLLIDKEGFGGNVKNVEWIENYPGFSAGVGGPQLASEMITQAANFGLQMELAEVSEIEIYSGSRCVQLVDGRCLTAGALIVASGCHRKKLNVPGERELEGKGVIECALCDGGQFQDKTVVVCGGGDSGVTEALYLTKIASKVYLFEAEPRITASAILQERARANNKLEFRCHVRLVAITGNDRVEAVEIQDTLTQKKECLRVDGVLIDIGMEPNTGFLKNMLAADNQRQIQVNDKMQTSNPYIFAAGDMRSNSPGQVVTAVGDGGTAAISIQKLLQQQ
ncbi:MAG: NAD(P)/FAD-dependent oxidoreductase [Flavisolibacter sp.]